MEKFVFRVISNDPDYDYVENVIEMVECEEGEVSYDRMEKIVSDFIGNGQIPSGKSEVFGEIRLLDEDISIKILEMIE